MMAGNMRDVAQFGAPLGEYRGGAARIFYIIGGLITLALGALMALAATGTSDVGGQVALAIVGVLFIGAAGYLFWLVIGTFGARVELYQGGFSATKRGKTTVAAWGDVSSITQQIIRQRYYGIPIWTSYSYRLTLNNGEKVRFTEALGKVGQMGETMQRQITHELTPRALEALRTGASLPFGKLSVNPMGIANGAETLPWGEISGVTIQNGVVNIGKQGKRLRWAAQSVAKTPNAYVFLSLVDMMRRGGQPQQPPMQPMR